MFNYVCLVFLLHKIWLCPVGMVPSTQAKNTRKNINHPRKHVMCFLLDQKFFSRIFCLSWWNHIFLGCWNIVCSGEILNTNLNTYLISWLGAWSWLSITFNCFGWHDHCIFEGRELRICVGLQQDRYSRIAANDTVSFFLLNDLNAIWFQRRIQLISYWVHSLLFNIGSRNVFNLICPNCVLGSVGWTCCLFIETKLFEIHSSTRNFLVWHSTNGKLNSSLKWVSSLLSLTESIFYINENV
jgi:hypothetical protein